MKYYVILISFIFLLLVGLTTYLQYTGEQILEKNGIVAITVEEQEQLTRDVIDDMIAYGKSKKGIPYVWGDWDCSKFISEMLKQQGILHTRLTTREFAKWEKVKAERGSLVLFAHKSKRISHIGLAVEVTDNMPDWKMLHNSSSRGVVIDRYGTYWTPRYSHAVAIPEIGRL